MCHIVKDVGILRLTEILWDHRFLSDVTGYRVSDCISSTVIYCMVV